MTREEECDGSLTLTLIADLWADVTKPNPNLNRNPCARLADLWTDVIDAEEYARFLLDLLAKMQAVREGEGEGEASGWVPYAKMEPISEGEAEAEAEAWVRCLRVKPSHPRTLTLSRSHALTLSRSHSLSLSPSLSPSRRSAWEVDACLRGHHAARRPMATPAAPPRGCRQGPVSCRRTPMPTLTPRRFRQGAAPRRGWPQGW